MMTNEFKDTSVNVNCNKNDDRVVVVFLTQNLS